MSEKHVLSIWNLKAFRMAFLAFMMAFGSCTDTRARYAGVRSVASSSTIRSG